MTTPSARDIGRLKQVLRAALLKLTSDEQAKIQSFGQMLEKINEDQASFRQIFKHFGIQPNKKNIASFEDEDIVEEKKAQKLPPPNFDKANSRVSQLKSVSADALFAWLGDYPGSGLYLVGRDGRVYLATRYSCNLEPRPAGLKDDSLVYVLNKSSGSVSIARDHFYAYSDVDSYQTPQEIKAQEKEDEAAALDQQRWAAYQARTGIYRDTHTGLLWYQDAEITYLGAPVRIAGNGRVFIGPAETDKLYWGRLNYDQELVIPVADLYRLVVPQALFEVVAPAPAGEPLHMRNGNAYDRNMLIADYAYYTDVLYDRFAASGDIMRFAGRSLLLRLPAWPSDQTPRHMTVLVGQGLDARDVVRGAIRTALENDESPGARLAQAAEWHVTIEQPAGQSVVNINAYPGEDLEDYHPQDPRYALHTRLGSPTSDEIIGAYGARWEEDALNARLRW